MRKLRNIWKFSWKNDLSKNFRSLNESIVYPEVEKALNDWKKFSNNDNYVLIGGLAYSFYLKPRATQDIDLIFISFDDIPEMVNNFKRIRKHGFIHLETQVEVETLDAEFLGKDKDFFKTIFKNSIESDGIKIASPVSLIALKVGRYSPMDKSDIIELIKYCKDNSIELDFSEYKLSELEQKRIEELIDIRNESIQNMHMLECVSLKMNNKFKYLEKSEYEILIADDDYINEKHLYFGKNIGKKVKQFYDFSFIVKIPESKNFKDLEVLSSSTDFKSFVGYEKEYEYLKSWIRDNYDKI